MTGRRLRVLELFAGIGGVSAALESAAEAAEIVAAVDVHREALEVYSRNFHHPVFPAIVESLSVERLARWDAGLWWMSPPCQPFTRRGAQRDVDDPRARGFLALLDRLVDLRPPYVGLENVPPFRGSRAHGLLLRALERAGYSTVREYESCPSALGIPNQRQRYYLVAARGELEPETGALGSDPAGTAGVAPRTPLGKYLDPEDPAELEVAADTLDRYRGAIHVVDRDDPAAVTRCFTSAYGRSPVRSGSYLATAGGRARFFSPGEVLRLLGFPTSFDISGVRLRNAWQLAGNSLSIAVVRAVLAAIPELSPSLARKLSPRSKDRAGPVPESGR